MTPRWVSRRNYAGLVESLARTDGLRQLCRDVGSGIAPSTWAAAMLVIADLAEATTGELRASQEQIADRLGRSPRTVRRALAVARALGLALEMYRGRDLALHERLALVREHGQHPQRGIPSVWQLGLCSPTRRARFSTPQPGRFALYKSFDHLPPEGARRRTSHLWDFITTTAANAARKAEAASPPQPRRRRRVGSALAIDFLASPHQRLICRVSPGHLAGLLAPYQRGGWRGHDLALVVTAEAQRRGWNTNIAARAPLAALRALLTHIDPIAETATAWAGDLCQRCYRTPGRRRALPLGPACLCPACWEEIRHHDPDPCQQPGCDQGWISVSDATSAHPTVIRCPSCTPQTER